MTDSTLQTYLPAFMVVATLLIVFWKHFRKVTKIAEPNATNEKITEYNHLKRVSGYFWIIFSLFGVMTIIYTLVPEFYYVFLPLDKFHQPFINVMGLLIMIIAIVWIVIAQVRIDKKLYMHSRNIEDLSALDVFRYSEKMLLTGMLVLFIGFFTTVTNILGLILVGVGVAIYMKVFFFKSTVSI